MPLTLSEQYWTLAHLFEDSTSPAHAADLSLIQELLPPPKAPPYASRVDAAGHKLGLHAAIELTTVAFRLDGPPQDGRKERIGRSDGVVESLLCHHPG